MTNPTGTEAADSVKNSHIVYAESVRSEMLPFIPESARTILDVGCSVGNFGALLKKERGAEVWGIEPDPEAAKQAEQRMDRVICGYYDADLDLGGKRFDCIVFNDVLEHMVDPYSALRRARSFLNDDGVVVASIPNVRYFGNIWLLMVDKSWEYQDTGILDRTHLRFFTEKSIRSTFENTGFEVLSVAGINAVDYADPPLRQKFRILNLLTLKSIADMRWMQFAVVAKPSVDSNR
jgi:2-polyprenyl-3-methyl-5-hydroxy-6-metoxy-1,4-benzoquinol methylase